jgi:hypothetical protein
MLFQQTAAPTGWTKDTTHDNKALRIVSGTVSSGGSVGFTTAFASQAVNGTIANTTAGGSIGNTTAGGSVSVSGTVGSTTLSESQMPSHRHSISTLSGDGSPTRADHSTGGTAGTVYTDYTGGDGSHNHSFSGSGSFSGTAHNHTFTGNAHNHSFTGTAINLAVAYVDIIIATKD